MGYDIMKATGHLVRRFRHKNMMTFDKKHINCSRETINHLGKIEKKHYPLVN